MPVSRPRAAEGRSFAQAYGAPAGVREEPASTRRPFVGLMRGSLFFLLDGHTVWGTAKILGSVHLTRMRTHLPPPCPPHKHTRAQTLLLLLPPPHPFPLSWAPALLSLWVWLGSRTTQKREREGQWGQPRLPVSQVSTSTL